jgi:hypothetical protein
MRSVACLYLIAGLGLTTWLAGCATPRVDWAARIGHYTYEQAVADLGAPEKEEKLADGGRVGEWLTDRGYTYVEEGPGRYGPFYATYPKTYTAPSRYLRLTFGTDSRLKGWKRVYR